MTQAETRTVEAAGSVRTIRPPSVLVVLVAKDGAAWLRQCLVGLSRQTYQRLGVIAIDNASIDGSGDLLDQALGADRVIHLESNRGFGAAVAAALRVPAAAEADYVLFLHDDALLAPDAIDRMVDTAERIEDAGIVGPKVLDWDEPRLLREVGMSSDRFAYPSSPLEEGEIDQGQYDRVREVLFVSSCAMLVSRSTWSRIGPPDERFDPAFEDLDFCWRARMAGFRILMTPTAEARHRGATDRGERPALPRRGARYERERCALAALLKNYSLLSLAWVLPLYAIQALVRVAVLLASRRFGDAYQVLAAWAWNVVHLPGTVVRRIRAQGVRRVPDREVRRYMAPAVDRLRRWAATARETLLPGGGRQEIEDEDAEPTPKVRLRSQLGRLALEHPVAAAWILGVLLGAIAYRNLLGGAPLRGGSLLAFPSAPSGFFRELGSGLRSTGLGGSQPASPALGILGLASALSFSSTALLQKVLLLGLPALAGVSCFRVVRSITGRLASSVVAGVTYALSATVLWALSEGRIPTLVFLAGLPWLATKLRETFDPELRTRRLRWIAGAGLGLAVLVSFFPGAFLVAVVAGAAAALLAPGATVRLRGLLLVGGAIGLGAVLSLPVTLGLMTGHGGGLADLTGSPSFPQILRLSVGGGPGNWALGFYLPLAAALSLMFVARPWARVALWAAVAAIVSVYLAWLGGAGYLPGAFINPSAFAGMAAFGCSMLVGLGLASLAAGVERQSFGHRQVGGAALLAVLAVGILAQAGQAGNGGWSVGGPERLPLSHALVAPPGASGYRILWLGRYSGDGFAAPSGPAESRIGAGPASVSFALTGPAGGSILDAGRAVAGPGYQSLRRTLAEILGGSTSHAGALLSPYGIRFVVARAQSLSPSALSRLSAQLDLDRQPGGDLVVFKNPTAVPPASVIPGNEWAAASRGTGFSSLASLPAPDARPVAAGGALSGTQGLILLSQQFDPAWRLEAEAGGQARRPERAFGWAVGFPISSDASMIVRFRGQTVRDVELIFLGVLWAAALWITRRPAGG